MSLNRAFIIGRLGKDPEIRYSADGRPVATFSVATDESYTTNGQRVEKTEWHRVVVWGKQADFCGKYLAKGRLVYVEGKLQTREWTDTHGVKKYTTEIIAQAVKGLDKRAESEAPHPADLTAPTDDRFPADASGMDQAPF